MAGSSKDHYDSILQNSYDTLHTYVSSGGWSVVKQTVWSHCYKAVGEITTTPQMTLEYLIPGPGRVRRKWDHSVKDWNLVETVNESSIVLQSITKSYAWGLISSRDFVDLIKWGCVEDSGLYYTCAHGIDHPSCPESSSYVRGWNYPCGMLCYPTDNGKTKMYYMLQCDIRGYLPTSLVESSIPSSMVDVYSGLQGAVDAELLSSH
ncbi:stAR-related lipid transfer protein 5-like isoform X2 [Dysidea avara]|uniref:stAR-related lipid transfer protein 5-like isoform X2 n=1 Tax=Dysidea avara TaxID=196820 RepID=UPI00331E8B78